MNKFLILCLLFQIIGNPSIFVSAMNPVQNSMNNFYILIYLVDMKLQGLEMNIKVQEITWNKWSI